MRTCDDGCSAGCCISCSVGSVSRFQEAWPLRMTASRVLARAEDRLTEPTLHLVSHAVDAHNLALIWPIVGACDEPRADRVLPNVLPLLAVALTASQQVVHVARLPKRRQPLSGNSGRRIPAGAQSFCKVLLHALDPAAQGHLASDCNEGVHVIRHEHVAANPSAEIQAALAKRHERGMHFRLGQKSVPPMHIKGDEVHRRIVTLENNRQPRRCARELPWHAPACSERTRKASVACALRAHLRRSMRHQIGSQSRRYNAATI